MLAIGVLRGMRRGGCRGGCREVGVLRADQAIIEVAAGFRAKRKPERLKEHDVARLRCRSVALSSPESARLSRFLVMSDDGLRVLSDRRRSRATGPRREWSGVSRSARRRRRGGAARGPGRCGPGPSRPRLRRPGSRHPRWGHLHSSGSSSVAAGSQLCSVPILRHITTSDPAGYTFLSLTLPFALLQKSLLKTSSVAVISRPLLLTLPNMFTLRDGFAG